MQKNNTTFLHFSNSLLKKYCVCLICFLMFNISHAQITDAIIMPSIHTARLHIYGDELSLPVFNINNNTQLELDFDDFGTSVKSYYYTFQLCDYNWEPVDINPFLYLKGFIQQRITNYRYSSIALTKYIHYQTILPDKNTSIILSGNYILKVFLNGDTSNLAFTKRLLVVNNTATIQSHVMQSYNPQEAYTTQKIAITANIEGFDMFSAAQQIKAVILQNNRWDNAKKDITPTFVRGTSIDFINNENATFKAGSEWRWLDLRNFHLQSDRVDSALYNKTNTEIFLKKDRDKSNDRYIYYADLNGKYSVQTYEPINPFWQTDYATVHFKLSTPNGDPISNKDIYLAGELTNYSFNDNTKMIYNDSSKLYECTYFLKQGFYNYTYIAVDKTNSDIKQDLEGNYWETENDYTILIYYKGFTDRADQLIGIQKINSRNK